MSYMEIPEAHKNTLLTQPSTDMSDFDEERSLTDDEASSYQADDLVQTEVDAYWVTRLCSRVWPYTPTKHLFLFVSYISAIIVLTLQSYIFAVFTREHVRDHAFYGPGASTYDKGKSRGVAVYLGLFVFAELYQILATAVVFVSKSVLQLYSLLIFLAAMAVYCGIQYHELKLTLLPDLTGDWKPATKGASIAVIAVSCVTCLVQICISHFYLSDELGGLSAFDIGLNARTQLKAMYFHLHRTALFLTAFFFPAFALQFILILINRSDVEFALTLVVMPVSMLILWFADYVAVRRYKAGLAFSIFAYLCGMAYVIFKLVRLYHKYPSDIPGRRSLIAFGIFTLVLLACNLILGVLVMRSGDSLKGIIVGYRHLPGYEPKQNKSEEFKLYSPASE